MCSNGNYEKYDAEPWKAALIALGVAVPQIKESRSGWLIRSCTEPSDYCSRRIVSIRQRILALFAVLKFLSLENQRSEINSWPNLNKSDKPYWLTQNSSHLTCFFLNFYIQVRHDSAGKYFHLSISLSWTIANSSLFIRYNHSSLRMSR
jgi:hypothetical protein